MGALNRTGFSSARGAHKRLLGLTRNRWETVSKRTSILGRGEQSDAVEAVMEATKAWWEREVERARTFFERDDWQTDDVGGNRPTLREVLAMLDDIETMARGD